MPDEALGDPIPGTTTDPVAGSPFIKPTTPSLAEQATGPSLVDQVLDLDAFLEGESPLPETTATFLTRPDLFAKLQTLHAQLGDLVDDQGRPLEDDPDAALDGGSTSATIANVLEEIRVTQALASVSRRFVRFRAMDTTEWKAWKKARKLDGDDARLSPEQQEELIIRCAINPVFDKQKLDAFKAKAGEGAWAELALAATQANAMGGNALPKSRLASAAQAALARSQS